MRRPQNLKPKYFLEEMTLCDVWKLFSYAFLWRWRSKGFIVLKFERHGHRDDTSIVDGKSRRCEVLIVFCVKRASEEGAPLGGGIELCGSSSCLGGLRSLLNTEGILTPPMLLLSDGSLIHMWSASFAWWCRVLLSLSIIVKSSSSAFGVICGDVVVSDGTGGLASVVWNSLPQGPSSFTHVFSCAAVGWALPVVDYISFLSI